MEKYTEYTDDIMEKHIIPDIDNLLTKEYNSDNDVINALKELEESWKTLPLPDEYRKALTMLVTSRYSFEMILNAVPFIYTLIFTMKAITYLFFKGRQFHSEISLVSSVIKINDDTAEDKMAAKLITEQISFAQDMIMSASSDKKNIILQEMQKNTDGFRNIYK